MMPIVNPTAVPTLRRLRAALAASILITTAAVTGACGGKAVPRAPAPYRPAPQERPAEPAAPVASQTDCEPTGPANKLPALPYVERSIEEAKDLARDGVKRLDEAAKSSDQIQRETLVTDAVNLLIRALRADPYNVNATYNLAAAYARIERPQCALNLLQRLIYMRAHVSKKTEVEAKLDRLLGRKRENRDPDFEDMRDHEGFRELVRGICTGEDDPACRL